MNRKVLITLILVVVLAGFVGIVAARRASQTPQPKASESAPQASEAVAPKISQPEVEAYIRNNISALSPRKEVLGGKFYVTGITFGNENDGTVTYEDGHIIVTADFTYGADPSGKVVIASFIVRPEPPSPKDRVRQGGPVMCAQVITRAKDPTSGKIYEFPTPCDVPRGWVVEPPAAD